MSKALSAAAASAAGRSAEPQHRAVARRAPSTTSLRPSAVEEDFVVAMRKGHPLARKTSLVAYLAAHHMLVSAIGDAVGVVDAKLAENGHAGCVALTVPNFMMALVQLTESNLVATLPRHLVERHAARFNPGDAPSAAFLDARPGSGCRIAGRDCRCGHRLAI